MSSAQRASVKDKSPLDDLFRTTETAEKEAKEPTSTAEIRVDDQQQGLGELRQTTLLAYDYQLDWLDQKCTEARRGGGKPIRKAVLIRSLLDLAISAPVDLTGITSEDELVERLEKAIKSK
jgi:hypothetical protein